MKITKDPDQNRASWTYILSQRRDEVENAVINYYYRGFIVAMATIKDLVTAGSSDLASSSIMLTSIIFHTANQITNQKVKNIIPTSTNKVHLYTKITRPLNKTQSAKQKELKLHTLTHHMIWLERISIKRERYPKPIFPKSRRSLVELSISIGLESLPEKEWKAQI